MDTKEDDLRNIKNALRKRMPPLEEARLYARLLETAPTKNQRELARSIGVSQGRISQRLALLEMPREVVLIMSQSGKLFTERHARAVRRLPDPKLQVSLAKRIVKACLSVEVSEDIVRDMLAELGVQPQRVQASPWSNASGFRWRHRSGETLILEVRGSTHAQRLEALKRFLKMYRNEAS